MIANDIVRSDFIKIDKEDTVSRLIGKFRLSKRTEAVVLDGKKYVGIVSKRKMIKSRIRADEAKIKHLTWKVSVLNGSEDIKKVAMLMRNSDVHMLPVVKKGLLKGVVYAIDVVKQLDPETKEKRVSDVVRGRVIAFDENTEVGKVMNVMHLRKIDRAPIVNKRNKLIGVVSISDLLTKYSVFPMKRPGGDNMREAKSSPGKERDLVCLPIINETNPSVVTAASEDRIKAIISLMEENRISDVVIVDEYKEPAAIITLKNLLGLF